MSTTTNARNQKPAVQNQTPNQNQGALQPAENQQLTMSERFTNLVLREFGSNVAGALQVSEYQKRLIQGYFISIDRALKMAEEARIRKNDNNKNHKYDNNLPVTWNNVNLNDLALDVVHYAKMGLDMMQDNHLFPIPYKNNKTNKYDVTLMPGYNGIQYIAEKYAVEKPKT
jgi:recombination protein RecT